MKKRSKKGGGIDPALLFHKTAEMILKTVQSLHPAVIWTASAVAGLILVFLLLDALFPLPLYRLERDYSVLHLSDKGELLRISLSKSGKYRIKMPLEEMSRYSVEGAILYEDRTYRFHPGVNLFAVARALAMNAGSGRVVSGASTITMQLAKMIEPKKRTYAAKAVEMFRALQLEKRYSKKRLLEAYLNTVPMGGNVEGIAAASFIYFNKPPSQLDAAEAALLISIPKSPEKTRPDINPLTAMRSRNAVLDRIGAKLGLTASMLNQAKEREVARFRFKNPNRLPHLVNRRLGRDSFVRRYTIDMAMQARVEYMLSTRMERLRQYGVHNAAVMVVRNSDRSVAAYAGSPDFYDKSHSGEVDGANIYRSPGSALKPFLYARSIDSGIITPARTVYDIEREYDMYVPANYDRKYHGPVTAEAALTMSLNIPAVHLEYTLGRNGLYNLLTEAGFTDMKRRNVNPGLSVALGAFPVTLEEMTALYAGLANGGMAGQLKYLTNEKDSPAPLRICSPEAAYIIAQMLAAGERPDLPQSWEFTAYRGKVAFKTGTSFGLRDAWCVGFNPDYTVGVWFGNADAKASFELVGIKTAAPFVIELFNGITRYNDSWYKKPDMVKSRRVCPVSGMLPGEYCPATTEDTYIEGVSSVQRCGIHRRIFVRKDNGLRADPARFRDDRSEYREVTVEEWPPEVSYFLRRNGKHASVIPVYAKDEAPEGWTQKPKILKPLNGNIYTYMPYLEPQYQKIELIAATGQGNSDVYWFLDGEVTATAKSDEPVFIVPSAGEHTITAQDSVGENDSVKITVVDKR